MQVNNGIFFYKNEFFFKKLRISSIRLEFAL